MTFYYFADSYINFNSLVTDLFKVYKTRIWMSAMNPASFAHPAGSGIPPSSNAPLGPIGEAGSNDGLHPPYGGQAQAYSAYATASSAAGAAGGMMVAQRVPAQQSVLLPPVTMAAFPPRHSPTATEFIPQSGYSPTYPFAPPGDGHGPNGPADWLSLKGLSLNSH